MYKVKIRIPFTEDIVETFSGTLTIKSLSGEIIYETRIYKVHVDNFIKDVRSPGWIIAGTHYIDETMRLKVEYLNFGFQVHFTPSSHKGNDFFDTNEIWQSINRNIHKLKIEL
jgi:hypothetical protein